MKIRVTSADIKRGNPNRAKSCAIAIAAKRIFKTKLSVSDDCICVFTKSGTAYYNLPRVAQRFIDRFDDYQIVRPFSFEVKA